MRRFFHHSFVAALMSGISILRTFGNQFYQHAFPFYRLVYATYKAWTDYAERQLLRKVLKPGDVAVDAGANIGIYSQFLARCVGPSGAVYSFEPAPENFDRLHAAARAFSNLHILQAAVGQRSRKAELYVSETLNVDHRTYRTANSARRALQIEMIALDDYFHPSQRVDLIKMDIQGYELQALRGAERVLADNPAAKLLVELWPYGLKQAGASWIDLVDALASKRMRIFEVTKSGLVAFRSSSISADPGFYVNLFASPG
jgi:FkbM family methyltransferase